MKLKTREENNNGVLEGLNLNQTKQLFSNKKMEIILVCAIIVGLIIWVIILGQKAQKTVQVIMTKNTIYKNQVITENDIMPYDMLLGEFEKYAVVDENGTKKRRVLKWEEKDKIINTFAAYPLKQETYLEYRDVIVSKTDNSDSVLYSFPGKDIIELDVGTSSLQTLKTFLQPGDKINIQAIYKDVNKVANEYGSYDNVETIKTETVFGAVTVADLINNSGESILDLYASYNEMSAWEQAQLDASSSFKTSTEPKSLLIALTPEELDRYYYYSSKSDVTFKISMPQREN